LAGTFRTAICYGAENDGSAVLIMADDKLFFTFMYRVYRDKLIVGAESLESSDVLAFFRLMQNESEEIAQWKDTTIRKLTQTYRKLLNDAGLLAGDKMVPPLPSSALKQYLCVWLSGNVMQKFIEFAQFLICVHSSAPAIAIR